MTQIDTDKLRALDGVLDRLAATLATVPEDSPDHASLYLDMRHGEGREIRAAILVMAEENRRLREALEPFAAIAEWWGDDFCTRNPDHSIYGAHDAGDDLPDIRVTMVDAVAARRALAAQGDDA